MVDEISAFQGRQTPIQTAEQEEERLCVICLVNERDTTVLPCRHMCMCHECAQELRKQTSKCPICREHVESLLYIRMVRLAPPTTPPHRQPWQVSANRFLYLGQGNGTVMQSGANALSSYIRMVCPSHQPIYMTSRASHCLIYPSPYLSGMREGNIEFVGFPDTVPLSRDCFGEIRCL
jgi:hypothetical protein